MPDLVLMPLSHADRRQISSLMEEEEQAWMSDLGWEYGPIRKILTSYLEQNLLPGYAAASSGVLVGYTYFLVQREKGIIGTVFSRGTEREIPRQVLAAAARALKETPSVRRIEAQILARHSSHITEAFVENGFEHHPRSYLELDLTDVHATEPAADGAVVRWQPQKLSAAAAVILEGYRNQADARICHDYGSAAGCEGYLRSLIENPGCGDFMPDASFVGLDRSGNPAGLILTSRISRGRAMIPQIAVRPGHQNRGLGRSLMGAAIAALQNLGFRSLNLTVTASNRRAFDWYGRLGFEMRREFGAYVWMRSSV